MYGFLVTLLFINTLGLIITILLQSGKSAGLSGVITGGAEQLFREAKSTWFRRRSTTCDSCVRDYFHDHHVLVRLYCILINDGKTVSAKLAVFL